MAFAVALSARTAPLAGGRGVEALRNFMILSGSNSAR